MHESFRINGHIYSNPFPPFQSIVLHQSSDVPIVENVFLLLTNAMVTMTAGTIPMKNNVVSSNVIHLLKAGSEKIVY